MSNAKVTELMIYPVKGCCGFSLQTAKLTPMGLEGDRAFCLTLDGQIANQKLIPNLRLLHASYLASGELCLSVPHLRDHADFTLRSDAEKSEQFEQFEIMSFGQTQPIADMGDDVVAWLIHGLDLPADIGIRLVRLLSPLILNVPLSMFEAMSGMEQSKFVDIAPVLLTNEESIADLNHRLEKSISMDRFRANIVLNNMPPYLEDALSDFVFPGISLKSITACERCTVTTLDQTSGVRGKEPLLSLSKYRKRAENYAGGIMFGIYLLPESTGTISVGDEITPQNAKA